MKHVLREISAEKFMQKNPNISFRSAECADQVVRGLDGMLYSGSSLMLSKMSWGGGARSATPPPLIDFLHHCTCGYSVYATISDNL